MEFSSTSRMLAQVVTPNSCPVDMEEVGNISKIWSAGCPLIDWGSCPEPSHFSNGTNICTSHAKEHLETNYHASAILNRSAADFLSKHMEKRQKGATPDQPSSKASNMFGKQRRFSIYLKHMCQIWSCPVTNKTIPETTTRELHMPSSVSTLSPPHPAFLEPHLTCATTRWYHIKDGQGTYTPSACMFVFPGQQPSSVFMDILRKICKTSSTLKIVSKKHPPFWFPSTSLNYHLFLGDGFSAHFVLRSSNLDLTGISSAWSDGAYSYMIVTTKWYSSHTS